MVRVDVVVLIVVIIIYKTFLVIGGSHSTNKSKKCFEANSFKKM